MNAQIQKTLDDFVAATREAFGDDLLSIVLFGSAAEDRLRPTSDLNVLVLLRAFEPARAALLSAPFGFAAAAARLRAMFLLESELESAALAFPVKFADIGRRHRVLWGSDPVGKLAIPRSAALARLRQVLLNLTLRLRAQLVAHAQHEERLPAVIAEAAGPLRASAAELLELEGRTPPPPKEALEIVAGKPLDALSRARETASLPAGAAAATLQELMALAEAMRLRAGALK